MPQHVAAPMSAQDKKVVFSSSLGTVFEWYDFYLYGALTAIIAQQFFGGLDKQSAFLFTLLAFASGFIVRPFGALVFGHLGDIIGRKSALLVTIVVMGLSTFIVGILPSYREIGVAAPIMLITLRLLQGFAMGGEYGGAAIFVAEHAPPERRGAYTAWIQATASLGLLASLVVVLGTRSVLGERAFEDWGWRVPFVLSAVLLAVSVYLRINTTESPIFTKLRSEGKRSRSPIRESLGRWKNLRGLVLALLGLTAGQAVVWYCSQFYALFFLTHALKVDEALAQRMLALALLLGLPFFLLFGALSDRWGRKPIIMAGCLLAALTYYPVFQAMASAANPALVHAQGTVQVVVQTHMPACGVLANTLTPQPATQSGCDRVRHFLTQESVRYTLQGQSATLPTRVLVNGDVVEFPSGVKDSEAMRQALEGPLRRHGYPAQAHITAMRGALLVALLTYLVVLVAMVYGPLAAMLAEMFPTRIRYTSFSLPYHIGNGWFGGVLPAVAFALVAQTGQMYAGLWYPIAIALMSFVVGTIWLKETRHTSLSALD